MKKIFEKLKERWELNSYRQVVLVLFIFSISGISVLFVRKAIFYRLGFTDTTPFWEEAAAWLLIVVPSYQLLFLSYGTLLGQFKFVWRFEKKSLQRIRNALGRLSSML